MQVERETKTSICSLYKPQRHTVRHLCGLEGTIFNKKRAKFATITRTGANFKEQVTVFKTKCLDGRSTLKPKLSRNEEYLKLK